VSISLRFAEMAMKVWKGDRSVYDDLKWAKLHLSGSIR
jgi:hypothetical protein